MPALRTLKVFPNPYKRYDHEGRPCNALPFEPEGDGVNSFDSRRFVGAQLSVKILEQFPQGDARQTVQDNVFVFSDEAVVVKDTPYYRDALKRGDLIPADPETARKVNKIFIDPAKALLAERDAGVHYWEHIEKHEDTDEKAPDVLRNHVFGPTKPPEKSEKQEEKKVMSSQGDTSFGDVGNKVKRESAKGGNQ